MRFFIYSRKSVSTGRGESIENQIELCRRYIQSKFPGAAGAEITVYEDEGFSAKNTDRPQFRQMLRDLERRPDYIVCYRLDRISRSVSDFSALIEELNGRGVSFVCIREEFDTSKPMGKAMMYIASVFAQLERETIAERVRDNMRLLARTGRWLGGTTPTGYTSERLREIVIDGAVRISCRLADDPAELPVIDRIFGRFLELRSLSAVSRLLEAEGVRSRSGRPFSLTGIKQILRNPVYCTADRDAYAYLTARNADICFSEAECTGEFGLLAYSKRDYQQKRAARLPLERWIIAIGRHRGRIPGRQWAAVQEILEANALTGRRPTGAHNDYALLSGRVYCQNCGERMFAKRRSRQSGSGAAFDYICRGKLRGGTGACASQNLHGPQADGAVWEYLRTRAGAEQLRRALEAAERRLRKRMDADPVAGVEARLKRCAAEAENLIRTLSLGGYDAAFVGQVSARISALEAERAALLTERERLRAAAGRTGEAAVQRTAAALSALLDGTQEPTIHEKRALVQAAVSKLVWDGAALRLYPEGM